MNNKLRRKLEKYTDRVQDCSETVGWPHDEARLYLDVLEMGLRERAPETKKTAKSKYKRSTPGYSAVIGLSSAVKFKTEAVYALETVVMVLFDNYANSELPKPKRKRKKA